MLRELKQNPIRYEEFWAARVIQDLGNKKTVYKEVIFDTVPTEADIVSLLVSIPKDCFVSVEHNYRLVTEKEWFEC